MQPRTTLVVGLACATAVSLTAALPSAGAPGPATATEPLLVAGVLYGPDGTPAVHAPVRAAVLPQNPRAQTLRPVPVAADTTDAAGRFELTGALPTGRFMRGPHGLAELEITGAVDGTDVHYTLLTNPAALTAHTARAAAATAVMATTGSAPGQQLRLQVGRGRLPSTDVARGLPTVAVEHAAPRTGSIPGGGSAGATALAAVTLAGSGGLASDYTSTGTSTGTNTSQTDAAAADVADNCGRWPSSWRRTGAWQRRMAPVQRATARRHSRHSYSFSNSFNTQLEVAYSGTAAGRRYSYSGGYSYTRNHGTELGMRMGVGNRRSRLLKVEWEYRRYRKWCGAQFPTNDYKWLPYRLTGGSGVPRNAPTWRCRDGHTVRMGARSTWVARRSNVRWSGFFAVAGVSLGLAQENSTNHRLVVRRDRGEIRPRVCGDNGWPSVADRVQERRG